MATPVVEMQLGRPAAGLGTLVASYVGYRQSGLPARLHRGLPSPHLTLVIGLDAPILVRAPGRPAARPTRFAAAVGGLHATPVLIEDPGVGCGLHVELTPLGARALFGLPARTLATDVVHLEDLWGRRSSELVDRLASASGWAERFALLDAALGAAVAERDGAADRGGPRPELGLAWQRIVEGGGATGVAPLAHELGWSRQLLGRRFRDEFGLSPKVLGRIVRFERSRRLLQARSQPQVAAVAAASGYFDQAHLCRDWRDLAGCAPTTWLAEEGPFVQDGGELTEAS